MQNASQLMAKRLNGCKVNSQLIEESHNFMLATVGLRNDEVMVYKLRK